METINERLLECARACENFQLQILPDFSRFQKISFLTRDCAEISYLTIRILNNKTGIEKNFLKLSMDLCKKCLEEARNFWFDSRFHQLIEACELCSEFLSVETGKKTIESSTQSLKLSKFFINTSPLT